MLPPNLPHCGSDPTDASRIVATGAEEVFYNNIPELITLLR